MYPAISFTDPNFKTKLVNDFKANGLAVISDVFTDVQCDTHMDGILSDFIKLGTGIDLNNLAATWTTFNLAPMTRTGLFQALVGNLKDVWAIRANDNIRTIFETLYSDVRGKEIKDFIVSGDGINLKPGTIGPYTTNKSRDWAHLDQTIKNDTYRCIQGQAVLTNTTASFVASPKSHLVFDEIMDKLNCTSTDNWLKFSDAQVKIVKDMIIKNGQYQIPILAKKGSFIVWSSTTVHSARLQTGSELPTPEDKYRGWRGVVYVCYRPKEEFTQNELKKRVEAYEKNRTTNHWGVKIFSKKPGSHFLYQEKRHDEIEKMLKDPEVFYSKIGKTILDDKQKKLLGL